MSFHFLYLDSYVFIFLPPLPSQDMAFISSASSPLAFVDVEFLFNGLISVCSLWCSTDRLRHMVGVQHSLFPRAFLWLRKVGEKNMKLQTILLSALNINVSLGLTDWDCSFSSRCFLIQVFFWEWTVGLHRGSFSSRIWTLLELLDHESKGLWCTWSSLTLCVCWLWQFAVVQLNFVDRGVKKFNAQLRRL